MLAVRTQSALLVSRTVPDLKLRVPKRPESLACSNSLSTSVLLWPIATVRRSSSESCTSFKFCGKRAGSSKDGPAGSLEDGSLPAGLAGSGNKTPKTWASVQYPNGGK